MCQFFQCFCFFFPQLTYIYVRIFYMLILRNLPHHTVCVGGPSPRHRRLASTRGLPGTAEWSCTDNTGRGNCQTFRSSTLSSSDLYRPWLRCVVVCGYGCECECVGGLCVYLCVRVTVHSGETVQYNHILLVWSLCMVVYIAESLQSMKFTE